MLPNTTHDPSTADQRVQLRPHNALALLLVAGLIFLAYGGFSWIESVRGRQVYPEGSLRTVMTVSGLMAILSLTTAALVIRQTGWKILWEAPGEPPSDPEPVWSFRPLPLLTLVAVLFSGAAVTHSMTQGRLAFPPYYDDVGYFDDALHRLHVFQDQGVAGAVKNYAEQAPHAPTSTLLALAGFLLFGTKDWAPPLMNAVIVLGILAFVCYCVRGIQWLWALPVFVFAMTWPIVALSVIHCIPDFLCCLCIAAGAWCTGCTRWVMRPWTYHVGAGALFGVALFAKPAMYPVTMFVFSGGILVAAAVRFTAEGLGSWRESLWAGLRALGVALLIAGPQYIVNWKFIQAYIAINTFGSRMDLWKLEGGLGSSSSITLRATAVIT